MVDRTRSASNTLSDRAQRTSLSAPAPTPYAARAMAGDPSTTSSATASEAQEVVIAADTPQSTMVEVGRQDQLEVPEPPYPDALQRGSVGGLACIVTCTLWKFFRKVRVHC